MNKRLLVSFFVSLPFFFTACNSTDPKPKPVLISANQIVFYTNNLLKQIKSTDDSLIYQPADYQISVNRITYQTTLQDGSTVTASGVVYLPSQLNAPNKQYPLLSLQHPTAFTNAEAPSGSNFASISFSYSLYFATQGYVVACPDYIGYGSSGELPHNYEHRQTLAQATVDMLLATKTFLESKGQVWNKRIFMAGYSEGGYATLSTQQLIEESYADELPLSGSICGAGPYAMSAFFNYITHNSTVGGVANQLYAWETLSYNRIYGLNKPVSYYFKSPYAEQLAKSLDNARSITSSFDKICTDQFRADVLNASSDFGKALADNDLTNWKTQITTRLIHSEQDEYIPYLTSQQTYTALRQRGSSKVSLVTLKGGHVPAEVLFMSRAVSWLGQLK